MQIDSFIQKVEKDKISIIRTWISSSAVIKIINDYNIDRDFFLKRYAFGVIEHYIQVVKNDEKVENCPVIIDFIKYLKKQNIKASELFLLCSAFKSALVDFVFKLNIQSIELIEKIVYYFENNFSKTLFDISGFLKILCVFPINSKDSKPDILQKALETLIIIPFISVLDIITYLSTISIDLFKAVSI